MIELLSPAGDFECLQAAVLYGANAVYIGGSAFGMRASPKNFNDDELAAGVKFAHKHGVKVYLTCNTIPTNKEADEFPNFIKKAANYGIDAVIVADFGVLEMVKENAPGLEIHISTQVGVTNYASAIALYKLGAKRIVLAREVGIDEISTIRQKIPPDLEIEAFIHGAMCVSYSGRCLLSSYLIGRDANRGECAQPCRWGYHLMEEKRTDLFFPIFEDEDGTYILNSKDLCMINHLDKLFEAGVNSFKVEGRAKSAYYTAIITNAYRHALNAVIKGDKPPQWTLSEVEMVSHREYSTGFYFNKDGEQYYESSGYTRNCDFVGIVNCSKNGEVHITQRNYFKKSDKLELVSPQKKPESIKISRILNSKNEEIEVANIAREKLIIFCDKEPPPFSFIRKVI